MPKLISREEAKSKGLKKYYTGVPCKNNHLSERFVSNSQCTDCTIINNQKYKLKRIDRWAEIRKKQNERYWTKIKANPQKNKDTLEKQKEWRDSDRGKDIKHQNYKRLFSDPLTKEMYEAKQKEWRDSKEGKLIKNKLQKKYYKDPIKKLQVTMRARMWKILTGKQRVKDKKTFDIIGCNTSELITYIESKFLKKMSWDNYGEWHVDHIIPLAYFEKNYDMNNIFYQKIAFNYNNLQPMWASENMSKRNKVNKEFAEKKIKEIKRLAELN